METNNDEKEQQKAKLEQFAMECTEDGVCRLPPKSEAGNAEAPTLSSQDGAEESHADNSHANEADQSQPSKHQSRMSKKKAATTTSQSAVRTLHSQPDLNALLSSSQEGNATVIVEFITSWCGACKSIAPQWEDLALENPEITCAQVVCDKNKTTQKLAASHGVASYPVFLVWHQGQQVQKWNGADTGKLVKVFEKYGGGGKKGRGRGGGGGGKKRGRR